jgi:nucleotide-binding universal stress UspA family protein
VYRRILVPLDGSRPAEAALAYARSLAAATDVRVTLLHVVDKADRDCLPLHEAYVERTADYLQRMFGEMRKGAESLNQHGSPTIEPKVVVGDPAEAILRWAARGDAALIIMTNDSGSGRRRWFMGSVASRVLQMSEVPVLLVHAKGSREAAHGKWSRTKLVILLDGSELAELALPHVEKLARQWSSGHITVDLVKVCEPPVLPLLAPPQVAVKWERIVGEVMAGSRRSAEAYLDSIAKRIRESGLAATTQVLEGRPTAEILRYASKGGHSIVVMTTHGRTGIRRWPFGGTAQKVLWGASGPILLVRPPAE